MSTEDNQDLLAGLRNEVLRRVGRNLLLFQEIERLMKFLLANTSIETGPSGPPLQQVARQQAIGKKTLGQLAGRFFEELFAKPIERPDDEQISELRIRYSFHISPIDADQLSRDQEKFAAMTDERNDLVHHFLERCQLSSRDSLDAALVYLDAQRERAVPLHQHLKQLHDTLIECRQEASAFLQSQYGKAAVHPAHLQSSRIVTLLAQATQKFSRQDGWTLLSSAGQFIAAEDPEQLPSIKSRFGHKGLQSLVTAAELFELREETITNGGKRTIYRIKPGAIQFV